MVVVRKAPKWCLRTVLAVVIIANIVGIVGPGTASADTWYGGPWLHRKLITIDAASGASALTNFPVLIQLTADAELGTSAQMDGDDILFTAADKTTKLDHEIEKYSSNGATANMTAWVRIPTLSNSTTTDIYMYYGNAAASSQQNASAVWDSNYRMVQHLEETAGGINAITDSTANLNNGTDSGSPTFSATGKADGAISFDGTNDRVEVGYGTNLGVDRPITIEAWIRPNSVPGLNASDPIIFRDNGTNMNYALSVANGTSYTGGTGVKILFWREDAGDADFNTYGTTTITAGNWYHVVITDDGTQGGAGNFSIYINGGSAEGVKPVTMTAYDSLTHKTVIGDTNGETIGSGHFFDGIIDEMRVSNTARSTGWIQTSYSNQNDPSGFILLGGEEDAPTPPTVTTAAATNVEETTADFSGNITATGGETPTERGFEWDITPAFTTSSNWTESGSFSTGTFSRSLPASTLSEGQIYYYRAMAKNSLGWGYGGTQLFITKPVGPTSLAATSNTSGIHLTWTTGAGATNIMIYGTTTAYPAFPGDGNLYYGGGDSNVTLPLGPPGQTFYFRAWSQGAGGVFSDDYDSVSATAVSTNPVASNGGPSAVEETTATLNGILAYDGGEACEYSFEWGTATGVYTDNITWTGSITTGQPFSTDLTSLTQGQMYYFRAKVINSVGTAYSSEAYFLTKPETPTGLSAITSGTTQIDLAWTPGTGSDNTTIYYKQGSYPTSIGDGLLAYNGTGSSTTVGSLSSGITYYFSAWSIATETPGSMVSDSYATANAATTAIIGPTVTTNAATGVDETVATISGTLTSNGGEDCTWILEWGTTTGVYTANTTWSAATITTGATFTHDFSGLPRGTEYYYRAGAQNSSGIVYGVEQAFLTKPAEPSAFIANVIGDNQIDLSWTLGDGAGRTMVRYRTDHYPTTYTDGTEAYFDTGTSVSLTTLIPGTTYYFSAWSEKTGSQQWSNIPAQTTASTTGTAPPIAVGGKIFTVSKARILAPWLALSIGIAFIFTMTVIHIKHRYYRYHGGGLLQKHLRALTGNKTAFTKNTE